ncbi:hypothetical protein BJ508DRAFT_48040 [Ascobolus immersus RN42]|uniref:BTB domain-containing protein n=1 Tax=Ascobolus immersus RN42 TaxID=1160509 RepID=A0A3N4HI71_ASCIM|nr:hypothetical protein BJ508DRAFT_48040 [Ascobolus immersus RN42]
MTDKVTTTPIVAPISSFISSPIITIHLVRSGFSDSASVVSEEGASDTIVSSNEHEGGNVPVAPISSNEAGKSILATSSLHLSALTNHSDYFKSLISFNGVEFSQKCVYLETPLDGMDGYSKVAFNCFVDFSYSGSYDLAHYTYVDSRNNDTIPISRHANVALVYLAAIYILADKLLSNKLKKCTLVKMRNTLLVLDKKLKNGSKLFWAELEKTVGIVFDYTAPSMGSSTDGVSVEDFARKNAHLVDSKERSAWLGNEPMRKMIAAYLAERWWLQEDGKINLMEGSVLGRKWLIDQYPELATLILGFMLSGSTIKLKDMPASEFGLEEADFGPK